MKPLIVTFATLAFCSAASAQSRVTVFGVVDAAIGGYSTTSRDERAGIPASQRQPDVTQTRTGMINSGDASSRLGFRGTEDLGGGLTAGFWLEGALANDEGGGTFFVRRSIVSLAGSLGEVRFGRDYTPTLWNDQVFDPFNDKGAGTSLLFSAALAANAILAPTIPGTAASNTSNHVRANNAVTYALPKGLGGLYGEAMYAFHERPKYSPASATPGNLLAGNNSRTGGYMGARMGYASGPLDLAVAVGESTVGDNFHAGTTSTVKTANVGASYNFGHFQLMSEFSRVRRVTQYDSALTPLVQGDTAFKGLLVGVKVPIGVGLIRASIAQVNYDDPTTSAESPKAWQAAIGYVHNLSKRTALYATVAYLRNKDGAALNIYDAPRSVVTSSLTPYSSSGYNLGIRHAF